jgi:hypothetical protein
MSFAAETFEMIHFFAQTQIVLFDKTHDANYQIVIFSSMYDNGAHRIVSLSTIAVMTETR